jgi:hypothetical protein
MKNRMDTTANSAERRPRTSGITAALVVAAALLAAAPARAGDAPSSDEGKKEEAAAKEGGAKPDAAAKKGGGELREEPLQRYYFLGVRFRDIVVPQFLMEAFADGGGTGNAWLVGPELSMRKNGMEIDIALAYADYGFGPAMFKGKDDGDIAYEIVRSDLKIGYLTFDLLFDVPLDEAGMFSFLFGGGIGIGVVAGDLYRNQAYPKDAPDPKDPSKWRYCAAQDDPNGLIGGQQYCDNGNAAYPSGGKQEYAEKSWIDGGSKPVVLPWLSLPQVSFRVKPIKQLQARADLGFSLSGFFFGLSAGYGF